MTSTTAATTTYVEVGDLTVHYREWGTGDPVIALHGWPETSYEWRHVGPSPGGGRAVAGRGARHPRPRRDDRDRRRLLASAAGARRRRVHGRPRHRRCPGHRARLGRHHRLQGRRRSPVSGQQAGPARHDHHRVAAVRRLLLLVHGARARRAVLRPARRGLHQHDHRPTAGSTVAAASGMPVQHAARAARRATVGQRSRRGGVRGAIPVARARSTRPAATTAASSSTASSRRCADGERYEPVTHEEMAAALARRHGRRRSPGLRHRGPPKTYEGATLWMPSSGVMEAAARRPGDDELPSPLPGPDHAPDPVGSLPV